MHKKYIYAFIILVVLSITLYSNKQIPPQTTGALDYKSISYNIDGNTVLLTNSTTTTYFGNGLKTDLNNDGQEDVVFLVTQQKQNIPYFYVVAAVKTNTGYIGSDGYPLGKMIAPQTIENSRNTKHKNVIVVNFADRQPNEPLTTLPSVGKSVYLKLDAQYRWGIVIPDFEGESR